MLSAVSIDMISGLAGEDGACVGAQAVRVRLYRLVESRAWIDAAFALVMLELPQWKVRRMVYEDGLWLCSLSRHPNAPARLADCAEARHESLPLAILAALSEAGKQEPEARRRTSVPRCTLSDGAVGGRMCCDNFA
jgi:hypothetical protein